jgi:hypothetical protein
MSEGLGNGDVNGRLGVNGDWVKRLNTGVSMMLGL